MAAPAWLQRRDPGLATVRQAVRVAAAACIGFYLARYVLDDGVLATYALFAAFALGFLSRVSGPVVHKVLTLLGCMVVGAVLITLASLLAGNLALAVSGMVVFGFLIAFAGVGGPRLVGLTAGLQLLFILPDFPPYALHSLPSRLLGLVFGVGLLIVADLLLWPDLKAVSTKQRLAVAADALSIMLFRRAAHAIGYRPEDAAGAPPQGGAATFTDAEEAAEAIRPSRLPPEARPASAGRTDQALSHASALLRYALARLGQLPDDPLPPPAAAQLLAGAGRGARDSATALRGGSVPETAELTAALTVARDERRRTPAQPLSAEAHAINLALVIADAVWAMTAAVRVANGAPVEDSPGNRTGREERFPYAYATTLQLWWQRFAVNLTPRSVYFQGAVRVALALGVARLVAGELNLQHGFWVLLATLTLLRGRAVDTSVALRPAIIGTIGGVLVAALLLLIVGNDTNVYAALLPPVIVVALASTIFGLGWTQALFTLTITLVFSQLASASVTLAEVRLTDVLLGAVIGVTAGLLAWPRGADGEMSRSAALFLARSGTLIRETARELTTAAPPSTRDVHTVLRFTQSHRASGCSPDSTVPGRLNPSVVTAGNNDAISGVKRAMVLADSSYQMYQTQRRSPAQSMVDWQAVLAAGHHIVRGSELLREESTPGSLAPWRDLVDRSAERVADACEELAGKIYRDRAPHLARVDIPEAPDGRVVDIQAWLAGIRDDLARIGSTPTDPHLTAP